MHPYGTLYAGRLEEFLWEYKPEDDEVEAGDYVYRGMLVSALEIRMYTGL